MTQPPNPQQPGSQPQGPYPGPPPGQPSGPPGPQPGQYPGPSGQQSANQFGQPGVYPGQQPPQHRPPAGAPGSTLKFTVQGNALTSNMVPPTLTIDGHPAPTPTMGGSVVIPIHPGPHHLEVHSQWLRRYGQASLDVAIQPNSTLEVFYAPPFHQFTTGAMGLTPQKRGGSGCMVVFGVILGLILLIVITLVIVAVVSA